VTVAGFRRRGRHARMMCQSTTIRLALTGSTGTSVSALTGDDASVVVVSRHWRKCVVPQPLAATGT
jgi:hypothetical protein